MRRLADLVRPEWRAMSVSMATLAVTTGISLVFPAAIGQVLDASLLVDAVAAAGGGGARFGGPTVVAGGLIALFAVQSALVVLRGALLSVSGERMAARLRKELFRAVLSQEVAWFDGQRAGDLTNRLSADAAVVQKALSTNIAYGLRSVGMVAGGTAALVAISPSLAALSLGLIPPVALGGMAYGRYLQTQQAAVQAALGRSMAVAEETVSNVRTVRAKHSANTCGPSNISFQPVFSSKNSLPKNPLISMPHLTCASRVNHSLHAVSLLIRCAPLPPRARPRAPLPRRSTLRTPRRGALALSRPRSTAPFTWRPTRRLSPCSRTAGTWSRSR
jgi:hypothetical protein